MSDADEKDKDKKSGGQSGSAPGSTGYQFFVDNHNTAGGYNFGLGNAGATGAPQFDTSLPDWFSNPPAPAQTTTQTQTQSQSQSQPAAQSPSPSTSNSVSPSALPTSVISSILDAHSFEIPTFTLPESPVMPVMPDLPVMPDVPDLAEAVEAPAPKLAPPVVPVSEAPSLAPAKTAPKPAPPAPPKPSVIPSAPPPARRPAAPPPPMAAVRQRAGQAIPAPLNLHLDKRFADLSLPLELSQTVERIFSLNDLDFNGYVDFSEIAKMLEGDELTDSEKQFVQLIYQVGKKIVVERPVCDSSAVPVMSKDDFKLAFASVLKEMMPGAANGAPVGYSATAQRPRAFRPTVYADDDYPLGSIKAQAVKLGTMGDACFAACLVSMIDLQPRSIMRMINNSHDQGFMISFPGLHGKVLELMPPRAEEIMHYGLSDKYGYWYPLMEKAYGMYVAQHHKLAASLEHGHGKDLFPRINQAMEALTNCRTGSLLVIEFDAERLKSRVMSILSKGKIVVAVAAENIAQGATIAGAAPYPLKPYAVQGFDSAANRMIVRGVGSVNTSNLDEAVLRLTSEQFAEYFKAIYYEKDLDNASAANLDIHPADPGKNPWRKLPDQ